MNQTSLFDDICQNRHRGSETSIAANPDNASKQRDRDAVLAFMAFMGRVTSKEVAEMMEKPLNAVSGRLSELKAMGLVEAVEGERRDGCAVLRVKK